MGLSRPFNLGDVCVRNDCENEGCGAHDRNDSGAQIDCECKPSGRRDDTQNWRDKAWSCI